MNLKDLTPIPGIRYYEPPVDAILAGRDGRISIPYGGIPVPLLEDDFTALDGPYPSYDAVGRGIYQLLRANPDAVLSDRYAMLLKEAYPHYLSELASHIIMLDHKDVEITYLDRRVNYLRIFALIEPENHKFPFEIGVTLLDKGLRLSALHLSTVTLYRAEDYLRKALQLSPEDVVVRSKLGEVCYLLGKYQQASDHWRGILCAVKPEEAERLETRLQQIIDGKLPRIPVVDYLEAVAAAFYAYEQGEYEESAAILQDVIEDTLFCEQFPLPEIFYYLGQCCIKMDVPRYAEEYLQEALKMNPDHQEARCALDQLVK